MSSPRSRWVALLGDLHFWIPLGVFVAGVALLAWLP
ncbi:MAG: translocated intimin receptor Tir [Myxococcota bacterium]